jgi:hypothetical protein
MKRKGGKKMKEKKKMIQFVVNTRMLANWMQIAMAIFLKIIIKFYPNYLINISEISIFM